MKLTSITTQSSMRRLLKLAPLRWSAVVFAVSLQALLNSIAAGAADDSAKRPNVLVIMTDDQGYGDMSCHGDPHLQTPNIDRLHAESIRFTDFHVSPFCTPTRAALMTGRYPARTGAYRTSSGRTSLHSREKTLGDLFNQNGYAAGMFGKWHLGDCAPSRPMDCGFEKSVWHRCGGITQISDYFTNDYFDDTYLVGDRWKKFEGYCTDVWFDEAMAFMSTVLADAGGNKPFFVYLPTNAPHGPYLVADKWKQPFLDAGLPKTQAAFKGMVANFDWNLGRLLSFLEREKLDDNTIVMFLTDNGTSAGTVFGKGGRITGWPVDERENGGMRGGKSSAYDGGHRVPLFVRLPQSQYGRQSQHGKQSQPRDIDVLSAHLDITPTLMELCDLQRPADWPPLDGRSLVPLMKESADKWPERTLHAQMHGGNGYVKPGDPWELGTALTERWRLVEGRELYDIVADPAQRHDVAKLHPDIVDRLDREHREWFEDVKAGMNPTRILLGSDFENPSDLTSQEWVVEPGNPPWARSHVTRRVLQNGSWHVDIDRAGTYRFTLSRWPLYLNRPVDSTNARISIAGHELSRAIADPSVASVSFDVELQPGPAELMTWLATPNGRTHGAYFVQAERIDPESETSLLWTQYTLQENGILTMTVHTDVDPLKPVDAKVSLQVRRNGDFESIAEAHVDALTAMARFEVAGWNVDEAADYRVVCGESSLSGLIRANPDDRDEIVVTAVACVNDKWFPYSEAVAQMIDQNPDLVFFAGDQIYESNAGGEVLTAENEEDVPAAMSNYLAKWRKFGLTFRDLMKDRPTVIITDDHDVYANDLWGDGGRIMTGDRTEGGYPMHVDWVNAVEATQTAHLPRPAEKGPWGDGIDAYFTSLDYGGVSFAILEDRKFKSPPAEVLSQPVPDPTKDVPNRTLEVIMDPAFDVSKLDRSDLNLLGATQERFVAAWASNVARRRRLSAVLTQSPFVNIGNYDVRYGDMDANGWPQTARNRALRAIAPSNGIMIHGDIHFGTLHQHGIDEWGDGPWAYSLPAFSSNQNRSWRPSVAAQGREIPGVDGSGNHHDRFGNKLTVAGAAHGVNGYGIVRFRKAERKIVCEIHTFDAERRPAPREVAGWPLTISVP